MAEEKKDDVKPAAETKAAAEAKAVAEAKAPKVDHLKVCVADMNKKPKKG